MKYLPIVEPFYLYLKKNLNKKNRRPLPLTLGKASQISGVLCNQPFKSIAIFIKQSVKQIVIKYAGEKNIIYGNSAVKNPFEVKRRGKNLKLRT